jgi:hypothetical protein
MLIEKKPRQIETPGSLEQLWEFDRLAKAAIDIQAAAFDQIVIVLRRSHNRDREEFCPLVGAYLPKHVNSADFRQMQIEQNHLRLDGSVSAHVKSGGEEIIERLGPIVGQLDLVCDPTLGECSQD